MNTTLEKFFDMAINWLSDFLPHLLGAIIILIVGMWLSGIIARLTSKTLKRAKVGETVISFAHSFVKIGIRVLVIIAVIGTLGFNIASLITALGAATVAIGLALQDGLKNIASGITILINKPFQVGDYLSINNLEGTVSRIDIQSTRMLTLDNKEVIIPNSSMSTGNIINYSSQDKRGVFLTYHVAYSSDIDNVKKVTKSIIDNNEMILKTPEPVIAVGNHGESSMEIIVKVWCKTADYWSVYYYMQENVKKAYDKHKIEIPFMQVDIHSSKEKK
ncbi:MAG: mechanosensitive ion channel domain-containing protein [Acutalibacteraceae bacterium]|nr:mechanosensitive ion channel domain-containing protein [Acutalibacteraceae bacterium]